MRDSKMAAAAATLAALVVSSAADNVEPSASSGPAVGHLNRACNPSNSVLIRYESSHEACSTTGVVAFTLVTDEEHPSCHACDSPPPRVPISEPPFAIATPLGSPPPLADSAATTANTVVNCVTTPEGKKEITDTAAKITSWVYRDISPYLGASGGSAHDNDGDGTWEPVHGPITINRERIQAIGSAPGGRPSAWEVAAHAVFHELVHVADLEKCVRAAETEERAEQCTGDPAEASRSEWEGEYRNHEDWIDARALEHYRREIGQDPVSIAVAGGTSRPHPPCLPGS